MPRRRHVASLTLSRERVLLVGFGSWAHFDPTCDRVVWCISRILASLRILTYQSSSVINERIRSDQDIFSYSRRFGTLQSDQENKEVRLMDRSLE